MAVSLNIKQLISAMRLILGNRLSRFFLNCTINPCPHGYETRLEHILEYIVNDSRMNLSWCRIEALALMLMMSMMRLAHIDFNSFKNYAKIPSVRRGLALVLKGIAKYGITRPQKLPAPFLVVWNFTNMCNLRCRHCYQAADKPLLDELTLSEKLMVVNQLDKADVAAIAFSGGEPLIHPHFPIVAREAASRGMYVAVATNGTMITRSFAERLKKLGVKYVEVSLDSVNPKRHDDFRGVNGAWERTVNGIRNCVEVGLVTGVAMTITKRNYHEVEEMVYFCEELGVNRVVFFNFIPTGRGSEIIDWDLTCNEREDFLRTVYRLATTRKIEVVATAPQLGRVAMQQSLGRVVVPTHFSMGADPGVVALAEFIGGCGAGRIYSAIEPNGDLTPCVFMPIRVGNLREENFEDLWARSPIFIKLRDRDSLEEPCGKCNYRYVCGGCRARAYAYTGNITGPDPGCINFASLSYLKPKLETIEKLSYPRC
ncbi:MAG: radical SAM protein [Candidatus Nezhaarchaeota archaeon]|nr:radical SAM protein [Candidatus Nezhaarchaeota archaeon]